MKNKIIEESITNLQQEGLRFSVDTLAERLKVSKKTIYKYFPTKEVLAYAIYEKFYRDLNDKITNILQQQEESLTEQLLFCYFDSAKMIRKEIFNKYCLNNIIGDFATQHHTEICNTIESEICNGLSHEEIRIYQLIIDGAFDRAIECDANSTTVIEMLRRIK